VIESTSLKAGKTFLIDKIPYKVVKYAHQKIGRGGGVVKLSLRNLKNGSLEEKKMSSSVKVEEINTIKKPLQYLYSDSSNSCFMDPVSFEQVEVPISLVENDLPYIKEGGNVDVLFWDDKALSIDIPPKVTLTVANTAPGVKGNSATNMFKPAELENGLQIKVPLFINKGDKIKVDTRTGDYIERDNKS